MFLSSLQARFALAFAVIVLSLTTALSLLVGHSASREVEREIGQSLGEAAYQVGEKLDRSMWARRGEISLLAKLDPLRQPVQIDRARELLEELQSYFPVVSWIGLTNSQGTVVAASSRILEGANIAQRPVFAEGRKGVFVGDVHDAVLLAKLLPNPSGEAMKFVDIAVPIHAADGALTGVLAAHLSWEWAREVEQSVIAPLKARRSVEAIVLSADRTVLIGPKDMMGRTLDLAVLAKVRERKSGWAVETWSDGVTYLTGYGFGDGYDTYAGLGWIVLVRQPVGEAYLPANELRGKILGWGALFSLVMAAVGWLVAGRIAAPLAHIVKAADRIRLGEENVAIPCGGGVREIQVLSASLQALIDTLTHKQAALDHMEDKAHSDALTGLPNRAFLQAHLPPLAARMARDGGALACLYLDLDGFKPVNDTLGHHAGDLLLREVGQRLRGTARGDDIVARLGGDEFVVVLSDAGPIHDHARMVAERIIRALTQPFDIEGSSVNIGCSIGIAVWPEDGADVETIIKAADCALYGAKRAGKRRAVFAADVPDCVVPQHRAADDQA